MSGLRQPTINLAGLTLNISKTLRLGGYPAPPFVNYCVFRNFSLCNIEGGIGSGYSLVIKFAKLLGYSDFELLPRPQVYLTPGKSEKSQLSIWSNVAAFMGNHSLDATMLLSYTHDFTRNPFVDVGMPILAIGNGLVIHRTNHSDSGAEELSLFHNNFVSPFNDDFWMMLLGTVFLCAILSFTVFKRQRVGLTPKIFQTAVAIGTFFVFRAYKVGMYQTRFTEEDHESPLESLGA